LPASVGSVLTTLAICGAAIASFLGGVPSDKYGRKATIFWTNFLYIAGAILTIGKFSDEQSEASVFWIVCLGRFIVGLGVGISTVVVPVLLSEIAPTAGRGAITTIHQLMLVFGILFVVCFSYGLLEVAQGYNPTLTPALLYLRRYAILPALFFPRLLPPPLPPPPPSQVEFLLDSSPAFYHSS
jgi:MFS family permease